MSTDPLHLLHTRPDPRRLAVWAARHGLLPTQGDLGYAVHALLHAAFGEQAPQPFRYLDEQEGLLAYTNLTNEELARHVALADADVAAALGLSATAHHGGYSLRPFPSVWPVGHMLSFEVRVRPIVREGKTGKERDAFLSAVEKSGGGPVDREAVYVQWLHDQLGLRETGPREPWQGAVELVDARLDRYRLLNVMRQTQRDKTSEPTPRQHRSVGGPDAVLMGHLSVVDAQAFARLLTRGVGRHRAFGFGLLLIRPVR